MIKIPSISTAEDFARHFDAGFWRSLAETICRRHNLSFLNLQRSSGGENIVFFVDDDFVIKIYTPFRRGFRREKNRF